MTIKTNHLRHVWRTLINSNEGADWLRLKLLRRAHAAFQDYWKPSPAGRGDQSPERRSIAYSAFIRGFEAATHPTRPEAQGATPRTDALHRQLVKISEGADWVAGKDYADMRAHAEQLERELNQTQLALDYAGDEIKRLLRDLEAARKRSQTRRCLVCGEWAEDVPGPTDPRWHVCVKHRGITKAETPFQYIAALRHDLEAARGAGILTAYRLRIM